MKPHEQLDALGHRLAQLQQEVTRGQTAARARAVVGRSAVAVLLCLLPTMSHAIMISTTDIEANQLLSAAAMVERFELIERAINTGQRTCSISTIGDPIADCDWIANISDTGPGTWEVTFANDAFLTAPMCFCGAPQAGVWCDTIESDEVSVVLEVMNGAANPYDTDLGIRMLCATEP